MAGAGISASPLISEQCQGHFGLSSARAIIYLFCNLSLSKIAKVFHNYFVFQELKIVLYLCSICIFRDMMSSGGQLSICWYTAKIMNYSNYSVREYKNGLISVTHTKTTGNISQKLHKSHLTFFFQKGQLPQVIKTQETKKELLVVFLINSSFVKIQN